MLCDCGQHEATIHEVIITSDQRKVERHLCEECARELGISLDPYVPISQLLNNANYIMGQVITDENASPDDDFFEEIDPDSPPKKTPTPTKPVAAAQSCEHCGQTFAKFKSTGVLGCQLCYEAFEDRIGPMIERAHEGGCNHVGKVPLRALSECQSTNDRSRMDSLLGDLKQREESLGELRTSLTHAVEHEDYEQAALLRDELTRLTTQSTSQGASQIEAQPAVDSDQNDSTNPSVTVKKLESDSPEHSS